MIERLVTNEELSLPLTKEKVLKILNPEFRAMVMGYADEFFSVWGKNQIERINIKFENNLGVMAIVPCEDSEKECDLIINVEAMNQYVQDVLDEGREVSIRDFIVSAYIHEMIHVYGYFKTIIKNGILSVQAGVDYRIMDAAKIEEIKQLKDLDDNRTLKYMEDNILFSSSILNELLTDHFAFVVARKHVGELGIKKFYFGYAVFGRTLINFISLVAHIRGISEDEVMDELAFSYAVGENLDDKNIFYSKIIEKGKQVEIDFFYRFLTAGYVEMHDPKFVDSIKDELERLLKAYE